MDRPSDWHPEEFGLRRALLLACLPVAAAVTVAAGLLSGAPAPAPPIMVQLAAPAMATAAPSPAEVASAPVPALAATAPPDALTPAVPIEVAAPPLADIVEAESAIPVPPMPAPAPAPSLPRPVPTRPAIAHPRPAVHASRSVPEAVAETVAASIPIASLPTVPVRAAAPTPADTSSGIGLYRAGLHAQIEQNIMADESVRRLGVTGVATIEAVIAPDGRVLSTVVARSSGNRTIDRAAQAAVQRGGYRAFGAHMPTGPITISVPITVGDG